MRVIFTDGHKEFMCMQSSKRSSNSFPRSLRQIITSNFDSFFFFSPHILLLLQRSLLPDWSESNYEVIRFRVMLRHEFWAKLVPFTHPLRRYVFFFLSPPPPLRSYVLGSNSSFLTSFIVSPDRILRLLLHVLQVKPIRQESYCLHSHFGFKSSFLL